MPTHQLTETDFRYDVNVSISIMAAMMTGHDDVVTVVSTVF